MSAEENKARIRQYVAEAWNKGNVQIIDELMAPNYARILTGAAQPLTRAEQQQRILAFRQSFPDLQFTIAELVAEGDLVAFHLKTEATHQGTFMGIPPTGRRVTIHAFDIVRFADDKVVEHVGGTDTYFLLQQLQKPQ